MSPPCFSVARGPQEGPPSSERTPEDRNPLGRPLPGPDPLKDGIPKEGLPPKDLSGRILQEGPPRTGPPRKDLPAPSYTMLAFHQWGFSSGWEDRIPVPVAGEDRGSGSFWWEGACRGEDYRKVWGCGGILLGHSKEVGGDTHLNQGG